MNSVRKPGHILHLPVATACWWVLAVVDHYFRRKPANTKPRLEPRANWPRKSPCAAPQAKIRGPCGVRIELVLQFEANRRHLPVVRLKTPA